MTRLSSFVLTMAMIAVWVQPLCAADPLIETCLVSLIDDVEISSPEAGIVTEVLVREGAQAEALAILLKLNDTDPQSRLTAATAELNAAKLRAEDDIEVRYAQAAHEVAVAERQQADAQNERLPGTVVFSEIRRLQLTEQRASLEIDRREMEQQIAGNNVAVRQAEVDAAQASVDRRQIASPLAGIVLAIYPQVGEWVQVGQPVARVARMDRIRVEGLVEGDQFSPSVVDGKPVHVEITLAGGERRVLTGTIVFVNPLVQAGNRYRVRAEVENEIEGDHWVLRPGMPARMAILTGR